MNDPSPHEPRLAATAVLPAVDAPAGDDFAATTLDRPAFDVAALVATRVPPGAPPASERPPPPLARRPAPPPESDALLWIVLALSIAAALGIACGLAVGLVRALDPAEAPLLESGGETERP